MAVTSFVPPAIEIHLAQDEPTNAIPTSPFSPKRSSHLTMQVLNSSSSEDEESDPEELSLRPKHLMPPPVVSPVRPPMARAAPADKKGIDQERFAKLLNSTRRKKEPVDMRRQVQLKAHQSRAQERRALFLSRLEAPPSNLAVQTPVTPPESPAIFHFTLPSPGLASPLALFEQIAKDDQRSSPYGQDHNIQIVTPTTEATGELVIESISQQASRFKKEPWIEEVDFKSRLRSVPPKTPASPGFHFGGYNRRPTHILPSLDQITAHLASVAANNAAATAPVVPRVNVDAPVNQNAPSFGQQQSARRLGHKKTPSMQSDTPRPPIPLPAFLNARLNARRAKPAPLNIQPVSKPVINDLEPTPAPSVASHLPAAETAPLSTPPRTNRPAVPVRTPSGTVVSGPKVVSPSNMKMLPAKPQLSSPHVFTPTPIIARLPFSAASPNRGFGATAATGGPSPSRTQRGRDMVETLKRRSSAPPQLPPNKKPAHRVMTMKGGF